MIFIARNTSSLTNLFPTDWFQEETRLNKPNEPTHELNKEANTWNVVADGESTEILKMNNDGTAQMYLPNGETMTVTLDAQGTLAARQMTMNGLLFAAR